MVQPLLQYNKKCCYIMSQQLTIHLLKNSVCIFNKYILTLHFLMLQVYYVYPMSIDTSLPQITSTDSPSSSKINLLAFLGVSECFYQLWQFKAPRPLNSKDSINFRQHQESTSCSHCFPRRNNMAIHNLITKTIFF